MDVLGDIPEDIIQGLAEIGTFGLSVPEEYGGFAAGGEADYLGMIVATEELSRGSLGVAGSLITRPEILTRALVGGAEGLGRGFYLTAAGFENGRLQTAARAIGVMQAAYEAGLDYARERVVFGQPVADFQLSQVKLARMAVIIQAARQYAYEVGRLMANGRGTLEAAMCKAYVCKAAEWVTREAMQLHGGMGYAEEYDVSRYFVDARVLSIFEGADELLCLRVIARRMIDQLDG